MKNFINHAGSLTSLKTFCGKDWELGIFEVPFDQATFNQMVIEGSRIWDQVQIIKANAGMTKTISGADDSVFADEPY